MRPAFSVMEMVLTIAVASVAAAVAIPRMGNATASYRAELAARRVTADLEQARTNARLTGQTQTCTFDVTGKGYAVSGSGSGLAAGYSIRLADPPYEGKIQSANFGGLAVATFNRYGEVTTGGTVVVKVGSYTKTVTLDAATGKARWR